MMAAAILMDREEAILRIADALDPKGAVRRMVTIARAEALLDEWLRDPPYLVDGAAPLAEAVQHITEEERGRWNESTEGPRKLR